MYMLKFWFYFNLIKTKIEQNWSYKLQRNDRRISTIDKHIFDLLKQNPTWSILISRQNPHWEINHNSSKIQTDP